MKPLKTKTQYPSWLGEMERWLIKNWGKRCPDYFPSCGVCDIWHAYGVIEEGVELGLED